MKFKGKEIYIGVGVSMEDGNPYLYFQYMGEDAEPGEFLTVREVEELREELSLPGQQ